MSQVLDLNSFFSEKFTGILNPKDYSNILNIPVDLVKLGEQAFSFKFEPVEGGDTGLQTLVVPCNEVTYVRSYDFKTRLFSEWSSPQRNKLSSDPVHYTGLSLYAVTDDGGGVNPNPVVVSLRSSTSTNFSVTPYLNGVGINSGEKVNFSLCLCNTQLSDGVFADAVELVVNFSYKTLSGADSHVLGTTSVLPSIGDGSAVDVTKYYPTLTNWKSDALPKVSTSDWATNIQKLQYELKRTTAPTELERWQIMFSIQHQELAEVMVQSVSMRYYKK